MIIGNIIVIYILLGVEIVLLLATIYLISKSREEYKGRMMLLEHMGIAIELLTREKYFNAVYDVYREAKNWIIATVTGSKPKDEDLVENLLNLMRDKAEDGVNIRILIPKSIERLYMGYRYNTIGAKVKYYENLVIYDLRYTVADGRIVVMGFPIERGRGKPTRKGVKIYSEVLASILAENFEKYWKSEQAIKYEDYLRNYVERAMESHPGITFSSISNQLNIPVSEIERVIGRKIG